MKKLLLTIGSLATITIPVTAVVACSSWNNMEINDSKANSTKPESSFKTAVEETDKEIIGFPSGDTLSEIQTSEIKLINASTKTDAEKKTFIDVVKDKKTVKDLNVYALSLLPGTDAFRNSLAIGDATLFARNDNDGSIAKVIGTSYNDKTKVLTVVTIMNMDFNTVNLTYKIAMTFGTVAPVTNPAP